MGIKTLHVIQGCLRSTPHPVTVTTRIITFLIGNPYKPSFVTVTGWGVDLRDVPKTHKLPGNAEVTCLACYSRRNPTWLFWQFTLFARTSCLRKVEKGCEQKKIEGVELSFPTWVGYEAIEGCLNCC